MSDTDEIKALLKEIRDEQRAHREEWSRARAESQQVREQMAVRLQKADRRRVIWWIVLAIVAASIVLPVIQWAASWAIHDMQH